MLGFVQEGVIEDVAFEEGLEGWEGILQLEEGKGPALSEARRCASSRYIHRVCRADGAMPRSGVQAVCREAASPTVTVTVTDLGPKPSLDMELSVPHFSLP